MATRMSRVWIPSPLEQKCLRHLDTPGSWEVLRTAAHDEEEILSWRPFRRVFLFNMTLFAPILIAIFLLLEWKADAGPSEIFADLPVGLGVVLFLAAFLSIYVMHLYRRSWNRRARSRISVEAPISR